MPVVLITRALPGLLQTAGIDVLVVRGAGMSVWKSLTFAGARAVGQQQVCHSAVENGEWSDLHRLTDIGFVVGSAYYPLDSPDLDVGLDLAREDEQERRAKWERTPAQKRRRLPILILFSASCRSELFCIG